MEYFLFVVSLIICFFILFLLSKNDLVVVRQNISLSVIFDRAFLVLFFSGFLSRILFIIEGRKYLYFHPMRFLYFPHFPGFSINGVFLGILLFLGIFFRNKKNVSRIYDIFLLSFFPLSLLNILFIHNVPQFLLVKVFLGILWLIFYMVVLRAHKKFSVRDGSTSILIVIFVLLEATIGQAISVRKVPLLSVLQIESFIFLIMFIIFFLLNQKVIRNK